MRSFWACFSFIPIEATSGLRNMIVLMFS